MVAEKFAKCGKIAVLGRGHKSFMKQYSDRIIVTSMCDGASSSSSSQSTPPRKMTMLSSTSKDTLVSSTHTRSDTSGSFKDNDCNLDSAEQQRFSGTLSVSPFMNSKQYSFKKSPSKASQKQLNNINAPTAN